jgi:hypothetical protein
VRRRLIEIKQNDPSTIEAPLLAIAN